MAVNCAKQTQFPPDRQEQVRAGKAGEGNPAGPNMQNKADLHKQTQPARARVRKTKPIRPGAGGRTIAKAGGLDAATRHGGDCAKQTQFVAGGTAVRELRSPLRPLASLSPIVRNEPNLPRTGRNEGGSARPEGAPPGPIVQNEANFPQQPGPAWDQLCETNPISAGRRARVGGGLCETKPICPGLTEGGLGSQGTKHRHAGDKHAKQSQFPQTAMVKGQHGHGCGRRDRPRERQSPDWPLRAAHQRFEVRLPARSRRPGSGVVLLLPIRRSAFPAKDLVSS